MGRALVAATTALAMSIVTVAGTCGTATAGTATTAGGTTVGGTTTAGGTATTTAGTATTTAGTAAMVGGGPGGPAGRGRTHRLAPQPGSPGIGDSYYPDYGNGGYDVEHYDIRLRYDPATDQLSGTTTILARATQDLSRFDLDFLLDVSSVRVNGWVAGHARSGGH